MNKKTENTGESYDVAMDNVKEPLWRTALRVPFAVLGWVFSSYHRPSDKLWNKDPRTEIEIDHDVPRFNSQNMDRF